MILQHFAARRNDVAVKTPARWSRQIHPDDFVLDLLDLGPAAVANAVREQALALKKPPMTAAQVLDILRNNGLVQSVAKLREL